MDLELNEDEHDILQAYLTGEIVEGIIHELKRTGLSGERLNWLAGNIAFNVASVIDNCHKMEFNGKEIMPYLTFKGPKGNIIHNGSGSNMHDYVHGTVDEVLSD